MRNFSTIIQTVLLIGLVILSAIGQPVLLGNPPRKNQQDLERLLRELLSQSTGLNASVDQANWHSPTIAANQPPSISRVSPSTPLSLALHSSQSFTARAADVDCDLWGSEWYLNGSFLGPTYYSGCSSTTSKTVVFNVTGYYRVEANSFDTQQAYSGPVEWDVTILPNQPPTISRVSPSSPVSLALGLSQKFTVQSNDADCDLLGSEWYVNGSFLGPTYYSGCSSTTFKTITFNITGYYRVEANSFDTQQAYSDPIEWDVTVSTNPPPTITRTSPPTPMSIVVGRSQAFSVQANDVDCDLLGSEWYLNHTFIGATYDFSAPYCSGPTSKTITFNATAYYLVEVVTFDNNLGYSPAIAWDVNVVVNQPPTIVGISPSTPVSLPLRQPQFFTVQASDTDCDLWGSEWYVNGSFKGATYYSGCSSTTSKTFVFNVTGYYRVEANSFDTQQAYSRPVEWDVTILPNQPPTFIPITTSPVSVTVGIPVTFTAKATDPECDLAGSEWYLGDGTFLGFTWYSGCSFTTSKTVVFNITGMSKIIGMAFDTHSQYSTKYTWEVDVAQTGKIFSITSSPSTLAMPLGGSRVFDIQLSSINGFSGTVSLSSETAPNGPAISCTPNSVFLPSGDTVSSACTVTLPSTASPSLYMINVIGTSGSISPFATVMLTAASCLSDPHNFQYTSLIGTPAIYVGPYLVSPSLNITVVTPQSGIDFGAFTSDVAGCFGFEFNSEAVGGAFMIISIGGFRAFLEDIDTLWNSSLGWLPWYGNIDLWTKLQFLFDGNQDLNFFGFMEQLKVTSKTIWDLANEVGQGLFSIVVKHQGADALEHLSAFLDTFSSVINFGAGMLVPKSNVYGQFFKLDLQEVAKTVTNLVKNFGTMTEKLHKTIELITDMVEAGLTAETVVLAAFHVLQAFVTGLDLVVNYIDEDHGLLTTALDWITTIVDPEGTTVAPSLVSSDGRALLGLNSTSPFIWNATGVGFVMSGPDGWVVLLANTTLVQQSTFLLAHVGQSNVSVPYATSLSDGLTSSPAVAASSLSNNEIVGSGVSITLSNGSNIASWTNTVTISGVRYTVTSGYATIEGRTTVGDSSVNGTILALADGALAANVTAINGSFQITLANPALNLQVLLLARIPGHFGDTYAFELLGSNFTFTEPLVGQTITFNGIASGGIPSYTFSWDFGDGIMGTGSSVSHAYSLRGSYTVTLRVTDSGGGTAIVSRSLNVSPQSPPQPPTSWWSRYWYAVVAAAMSSGVLSALLVWRLRRKTSTASGNSTGTAPNR